MEIKDFKPLHMTGFEFRDEDIDFFIDNEFNPLEVLMKSTHAVTLFDSKPLALVGAIKTEPGVYAIYQFPRKDFKKSLKTFLYGMRELMEEFMQRTQAYKLFTMCENEKRYEKWLIRGLNWKYEKTLKNQGNNKEDWVQYQYTR